MAYSYYEEYAKIASDATLAKECVSSNPYKSLSNEVEEAQTQIKKINFNNWKDENGVKFKKIVDKIQNKLSTISYAIDTCMSKSDEEFKILDDKIKELKTADEDYQKYLKREPRKENYKTEEGQIDYDYYNSEHNKWKMEKSQKENFCIKLKEDIKQCINNLETINSLSIDETAINQGIGKANFTRKDEVYKYNDYEFTPYESFLLGDLFGKIDVTLFGLTNDDILGYIYNERDWDRIIELSYYTPSNFNDFIGKADMTAYSYEGLIAKRGLIDVDHPYSFSPKDDVEYYSHMLDIGGNQFEFIVNCPTGIKTEDPLKYISFFSSELNGINQLTHYTSEQLNQIATPERNTTNKTWTTFSYVYGDMNIGGGYHIGKRDIDINMDDNCGFDYRINALNHECGHKIDDIGASDDPEVNLSNNSEWQQIVLDKIEAIERILTPNYVENEIDIANENNYNNHVSECMAEVNKYYVRYPDEFKIVAPELYERYESIVNPQGEKRDITHTITMNNQAVSPDDESDKNLYVGGAR